MYIVGSPRAGDPEFAEALSALVAEEPYTASETGTVPGSVPSVTECMRVVNTADMVTQLPLAVTPTFLSPDAPFRYQHIRGDRRHAFSTNGGSWRANHSLGLYMNYLADYHEQ
jgi:hypothetical protein